MEIYDFWDYKKYIGKTFESRPRQGRGLYRQLGQHLGMSSVSISQIFSGDRDLSLEQALETTKFLSLNGQETEYFLLLVQYARAGTSGLKSHYKDQIQKLQVEQVSLSKRNRTSVAVDVGAQALFYSNWTYSAVRIASSIPKHHSPEAIAELLKIERSEVVRIAEFLVSLGLCVRHPKGYDLGPSSTMLSADSPFINNHRRNWRLKGLENLHRIGEQDLFYSGLVSLSEKDLALFKKQFVGLLSDFIGRVKDSPPETMACLNLDWFQFRE